MQNAKVLNQMEVREILARHFDVSVNQVINSKYSFIIVGDEDNDDPRFKKEVKNV